MFLNLLFKSFIKTQLVKILLRIRNNYKHHHFQFLKNLLLCLNEMISWSLKILLILPFQKVYQHLDEQTKHYSLCCFLSNLNKLIVDVWDGRSNVEALACCVFNCKGWLIIFIPSHIWDVDRSIDSKLIKFDNLISRLYCLLLKFNLVQSHNPQDLVFIFQWPPRHSSVTHSQIIF